MSTSSKIVRHGKSSEGLLGIKRSFFDDNDEFLAYERRLAELYVAQPRRTSCMCCAGPLDGARFTKQGVEYILCARCGHLTGAHVDTDAYAAEVYTAAGGAEYAKFYTADGERAYRERMEVIYLPKVDFLLSSLRAAGEAPEALRYCDLGAGSGYLVASLIARGLASVAGYEIAAAQVELANRMIGRPAVQVSGAADAAALARTCDADVLCLIGTLEHLQQPRAFLDALAANPRVKYLLISVPLFAPSVFFEMVFPDVMQRQLSGGHTHLYTASSLAWMADELGFESIAEWWFGTDIVDLYRAVLVTLRRDPATAAMAEVWSRTFAPAIDDLQLVLDRRQLSSEVQILYRTK